MVKCRHCGQSYLSEHVGPNGECSQCEEAGAIGGSVGSLSSASRKRQAEAPLPRESSRKAISVEIIAGNENTALTAVDGRSGEAESELQKVENELAKVRADIANVDAAVARVELKITEAEENIRTIMNSDDYLKEKMLLHEEKENKLLDERKLLREKENKLLDRETQLREESKLLDQPTRNNGTCVRCSGLCR